MTTKPRKRIAPISAKRLAADPDLRLRNSTIAKPCKLPAELCPLVKNANPWVSARSPLQQTPRTRKPIPKVNGKAKARRDASYRKYMGSKEWKALRLKVFERDGWQCTATVSYEDSGLRDVPCATSTTVIGRCGFRDWTNSGRGLICDHKTYARFRHELLTDLRTLCKTCNARLTVSERANWAQPGKRT